MGEFIVRVESRELGARPPRPPRFIQLGGFTDTLLVEGGFAVLRELLMVPVGTMGSF